MTPKHNWHCWTDPDSKSELTAECTLYYQISTKRFYVHQTFVIEFLIFLLPKRTLAVVMTSLLVLLCMQSCAYKEPDTFVHPLYWFVLSWVSQESFMSVQAFKMLQKPVTQCCLCRKRMKLSLYSSIAGIRVKCIKLPAPCLSHEHHLVSRRYWSEGLHSGREMLQRGDHNLPKSLEGCTPDPMALKRN